MAARVLRVEDLMTPNSDQFRHKRIWGPEPRYKRVLAYPASPSDALVVLAGPCSIESPERTDQVAGFLASHGVKWMRGGVFRAGTYPPQGEFGLQWDLLHSFSHSARSRGLKVIVEPIDLRLLDAVDPFVDGFQVGARQMQNYPLLEALSGTNKVVTLKRNMGATLDEFLGAAEYLLGHSRYSPKVHLVERGISTFNNHVRWTLDVSCIATIKTMTGLPILVDASHGTGRRDIVGQMTLAGVAAGADGFIVEVHPKPSESRSDADQAYPIEDFPELLVRAKAVKAAASFTSWEDVKKEREELDKEPCPASCQDGRGMVEP